MTAPSNRMYNDNRFKLGLFGANCSGSFATTAPVKWEAGWAENLEAAQLADEAGLEFNLPIARWQGYGALGHGRRLGWKPLPQGCTRKIKKRAPYAASATLPHMQLCCRPTHPPPPPPTPAPAAAAFIHQVSKWVSPNWMLPL